jgi:hypothetical protein
MTDWYRRRPPLRGMCRVSQAVGMLAPALEAAEGLTKGQLFGGLVLFGRSSAESHRNKFVANTIWRLENFSEVAKFPE